MRKYILCSVLLILAIALTFTLSSSISRIFSSKPIPQSNFRIVGQEKMYNSKIFNYSWAGKYNYGESSVVGTPFDTVTVFANSKLEISFDNPPKEKGVLGHIFEEDIDNYVFSEDYSNIITVPERPGIYTYYYTGSWKEGSIAYIFRIKVIPLQ